MAVSLVSGGSAVAVRWARQVVGVAFGGAGVGWVWGSVHSFHIIAWLAFGSVWKHVAPPAIEALHSVLAESGERCQVQVRTTQYHPSSYLYLVSFMYTAVVCCWTTGLCVACGTAQLLTRCVCGCCIYIYFVCSVAGRRSECAAGAPAPGCSEGFRQRQDGPVVSYHPVSSWCLVPVQYKQVQNYWLALEVGPALPGAKFACN